MINVVVPVYNEGKNIKKLLDEVALKIKTPLELIIVYDFDEDNTIPVINKIRDQYNFKIITSKNNIGRGALNAIKTGFLTATKDVILVTMADLSDSLEIVDHMYEKIIDGFDVVCASRYMKGGKQFGGPWLKKTFSRLAGVSLHYLIGIPTHDISNSFRMYHKRVIDAFTIESNGGFEIGMELTVKAYTSGYKVTEIPSQWYDRIEGKSNFKMWKWLPKYLKWYWYGIKNTWFKVKRKESAANENRNTFSA